MSAAHLEIVRSEAENALAGMSTRDGIAALVAAYRAGRAVTEQRIAESFRLTDELVSALDQWTKGDKLPERLPAGCAENCGDCDRCWDRHDQLYERHTKSISNLELLPLELLDRVCGTERKGLVEVFALARQSIWSEWSTLNVPTGDRIVEAMEAEIVRRAPAAKP